MIPNKWPWSWEEEVEWQEEMRQVEFGWMDELIDHMINDGLACSSYDPLQPQEDSDEKTVVGWSAIIRDFPGMEKHLVRQRDANQKQVREKRLHPGVPRE
jgi:hypothetical protein